ncbi:hypothetical protein J2X46_003928 [Nocardioides sp. BE266]|uniref:hypothetical protein n=1 Tax=Nocardioides sp. BE266 TaxID=2817725 RepID=UPI00285FF064|nr:hypothetical protein [Nocardioides sp. BE266]MDR7254926.1 hypothetical protein [Nocardioides sp. BE266]
MSQQTGNEVEPRMAYASTALRYWTTYLPSRLGTIPVNERQAFFEDLGRQVAEMVDYLAADNLRASSRPHDPPELTRRRATMARMRAEDEALAELVYLPKEKGTRGRETPTTLTAE